MDRVCSLSVDLDTVPVIGRAYGVTAEQEKRDHMEKAVRRFLTLFRKAGVKATFFVIGEEINTPRRKELIAEIHSQGHEIANHTFSHPFGFSRMGTAEKGSEIDRCSRLIKEVTGVKPRGFRAPAWDIDNETLRLLEKRNYLYDSSLIPSFFTKAMSLYMAALHREKKTEHPVGKLRYSLAPRQPYRPSQEDISRRGTSRVIELPVATTPLLRFPFYMTTIMMLGRAFFCFEYPILLRTTPFLNLELHLAELVDPEKDFSSPSLSNIPHKILKMPLDRKLRIYNKVLSKTARDYRIATLAGYAESIKAAV
jgi:hypothetical protein